MRGLGVGIGVVGGGVVMIVQHLDGSGGGADPAGGDVGVSLVGEGENNGPLEGRHCADHLCLWRQINNKYS